MTNGLGIDRIVVILDPGGEYQAAIHSAVELASALQLPLHGIFAEDDALLGLAHLSVASHMGLGNLRSGALESGLLVAALVVEARRSQHLFEAVAEGMRVATSFAIWRGHPNLLDMGARESDLVVVAGFSRPLTGQAQLRSPWGRRLAADGVSVLVLKRTLPRHLVIGSMADDGDTARALRIAGPLAKQLAGSIVQLSAGETSMTSSEPGDRALVRRLADLKCDMVVLDEGQTDAETSAILIAEGACSVLLLRRY